MESTPTLLVHMVLLLVEGSVAALLAVPFAILNPAIATSVIMELLFQPAVGIGWCTGATLMFAARSVGEVSSRGALYLYGALYTFATTLCAMVLSHQIWLLPSEPHPYDCLRAVCSVATAIFCGVILGGPTQLLLSHWRR